MTKPIERVAILGAGALGAFYGSKFFEMDENSICFVAKGERYERLIEKGVYINNTKYRVKVVKPEDAASPSDFIIVALKHHHLPEAIGDIRNQVGADTLIMSVMNGIESEEYLGAVYGMDKVLYCVSVGIDALREENRHKSYEV